MRITDDDDVQTARLIAEIWRRSTAGAVVPNDAANHVRAVLVLLMTCCMAGCGPAGHASRGEPLVGRFAREVHDVDADAKWHALAPRSATWGAQQEEIPEQDRKRLALELLWQGGFRCDRTKDRPHCVSPLEMDEPRPDEGLEAPCFRRVLASWALLQLDGNDLGALSGLARSIMSLPAPEAELKLEVLEMFAESAPDQLLSLLTEAARAGFDVTREERTPLIARLSPADQRTAMRRWRVSARSELAPAELAARDRDAALNEIAAPNIDIDTRLELISALVPDSGPLPEDLHHVMVEATRDRDCWAAARFGSELAAHGDLRFSPERPRRRDVAANVRVLCMAASNAAVDHSLREYIPAQGTVEIYHHIDGARHTRSDTSRVVHRNHTYVWESKDLRMALSDCTTTHCAGGDHVVDLTFAPAFDGGLELTTIERTEYVNACGPSMHEFGD